MKKKLRLQSAKILYSLLLNPFVEIMLNPWFCIPSDRKMKDAYVKRLNRVITLLDIDINFGESNTTEQALYIKAIDMVDLLTNLNASTRRNMRQKENALPYPRKALLSLNDDIEELCELAAQVKKASRLPINHFDNGANKHKILKDARDDIRWHAQRFINRFSKGT